MFLSEHMSSVTFYKGLQYFLFESLNLNKKNTLPDTSDTFHQAHPYFEW